MAKHEGHAVEQVEIDGSKVKVICSCGWKSKVAKDENTARELHDTHREKS